MTQTTIIKMTKEEWLAKGKELFGEDMFQWRFVCPGCGNIQSVNDFKQYKEKGASPNSASNECIGRYSDGNSWLNTGGKKQPCDYAGYGLLNICPVKVIDGEKKIYSFAFDGG